MENGVQMERDVYPTVEDVLTKQPTECDICGKSFSSSSSLRLHRIKGHQQIQNNGDLSLSLGVKSQNVTFFHCPDELCDVKFNGMRMLRQHYLRKHTEKNIVCVCGVRFAIEKDLVWHLKARCPQRSDQEKEAAKLKKKKTAPKQVKEPVSSSTDEGSTVILVIRSAKNVDETIKLITAALKSTATVGIQASFPGQMASTSTIAVGEGQIQQFSDFSGQFNAPMDQQSYFYQENNPEVRHISTGTDFSMPSYMQEYSSQMANYDGYEEYGRNDFDPKVNMGHFQPETPLTRNFGTTMDGFMPAEPSDFDMMRVNIETQTMSEAYWTKDNGQNLID